ncbi:MAG: ROK family protein [Anaerolineae bacterium]|nr:MAG: ROK family protein [Anaerolineae bacterium]
MKTVIGVDIGGTKIDFILMNEQGTILDNYRLATAPEEGEDAVLNRIAQGIEHFLHSHTPAGIGIGCPGYVDSVQGIVRNAVNLHWTEVKLVDAVRQRLDSKLPIFLQNDVNAAALGELYFGAAQNDKDVIYAAVGTGLGGAAIVNGSIVNGADGFAMEIGHLVIRPHGRLCRCGLHGCAEMYASGQGLLASVREYANEHPDTILNPDSSTADILAAAKAGDSLGLRVFQDAAAALGYLFGICANFFNPRLIVIGGGLGMAAAEFLFEPARQEMQRCTPAASYQNLRLVPSQIERIAVGAACLALG